MAKEQICVSCEVKCMLSLCIIFIRNKFRLKNVDVLLVMYIFSIYFNHG